MREPVCYILTTDGNNYIAFDVVTSIQWSLQGRLSSSMVQSGTAISDHYDPDSATLNMSGIVSETKLPSKQDYLSPAEIREEVVKLMESRTPFKLFGTEDGAIPDMDNCVITSFNLTRDVNNEGGAMVSLSVKEINFTNALVPTDYVPVDTALTSIAAEKKKASGGKTDAEEKDALGKTAALNSYYNNLEVVQKAADSGTEVDEKDLEFVSSAFGNKAEMEALWREERRKQ